MSGEVEDGKHFLFKCQALSADRNEFLELMSQGFLSSDQDHLDYLKNLLTIEHIKKFAIW